MLGPMGPASREEPVISMGPVDPGLQRSLWDPTSWSDPMPKVTSHKAIAQQTQAKKQTTHQDEKIALVLFLAGGFTIWNFFNETRN